MYIDGICMPYHYGTFWLQCRLESLGGLPTHLLWWGRERQSRWYAMRRGTHSPRYTGSATEKQMVKNNDYNFKTEFFHNTETLTISHLGPFSWFQGKQIFKNHFMHELLVWKPECLLIIYENVSIEANPLWIIYIYVWILYTLDLNPSTVNESIVKWLAAQIWPVQSHKWVN